MFKGELSKVLALPALVAFKVGVIFRNQGSKVQSLNVGGGSGLTKPPTTRQKIEGRSTLVGPWHGFGAQDLNS